MTLKYLPVLLILQLLKVEYQPTGQASIFQKVPSRIMVLVFLPVAKKQRFIFHSTILKKKVY
jgi:hypothetical protein